MTITTMEALGFAYDSDYSDVNYSKAGISNAGVGAYVSLWPSVGNPLAGSAPGGVGTGPVSCSTATTGAMRFTQQTAPRKSYIAEVRYTGGQSAGIATNHTFEIHDRLAHISGLSGISTTTQITAFDFASLSLFNISDRKGDANYSDIQWWLEWYANTGGTASNATLAAVYNDGTSSNLTALPIGGVAVQAGRMIPLNSLVPTADQGKFIRGINSVTLSASTGTTGNFGITATRYRCSVYARTAFKPNRAIWQNLSFPEIYNDSCLFGIQLNNSTGISGTANANIRIVHG
jgi:hypothetical protein